MVRKPIDVSVDALVMMFAILIVIVLIVPQVRVIDRHLTNELGEADTIRIALDLSLLCLKLIPVRRLRLLNLALGKISLFRRGIRRILNLGLI